MKKLLSLSLILATLALLLTGCSSPGPNAEAEDIPFDVEIKEKLFIAQTNDIYLNEQEYMGKTIKYEGMFFSSWYTPTDTELNMVIRYGPGCCGDDDTAGFEVFWDNKSIKKPGNNDWVEAIGVLEQYEEMGNVYLRLNLVSLRVLDKRGAETVLQ